MPEGFAESARDALGELPEGVRAGVSALERHGLVLRLMGPTAQANREPLWRLVNYYRRRHRGLNELDLRKNDR